MSVSRQTMVERLAARTKGAAAWKADDKLRREAYSIAKDMGTATESPATRKLADAYFQAVDRSKPESVRAAAAKALWDQLQAHVDHAKSSIKVFSNWVELFKKAEKEHVKGQKETPWHTAAVSDNDGLMDAVREFQAARTKTANWWNVVLVRDEGGNFSVGVMGEQPAGPGWHGLSYMMKEVNGRIKKEADKVVKFLEAQGFKVMGGKSPTFGTQERNNYVGWGFYGRKDPDADLMKLLEDAKKQGVFSAYLKDGYTGI